MYPSCCLAYAYLLLKQHKTDYVSHFFTRSDDSNVVAKSRRQRQRFWSVLQTNSSCKIRVCSCVFKCGRERLRWCLWIRRLNNTKWLSKWVKPRPGRHSNRIDWTTKRNQFGTTGDAWLGCWNRDEKKKAVASAWYCFWFHYPRKLSGSFKVRNWAPKPSAVTK